MSTNWTLQNKNPLGLHFKKDNRKVALAARRGGIITSLVLGGQELLYMDKKTFLDPTKNVRGGIPILFPNAGHIDHPKYPNLKHHGFARDIEWSPCQATPLEYLYAGKTTQRIFPHLFRLKLEVLANEPNAVTILVEVRNTQTEDTMPLAMGLHPYFRVPRDRKDEIDFDFPGGEEVKARREEWKNGKAISLANPASFPLRVSIPELGVLFLTPSPEYKRIWIWSLPDKDFICIEPVMRDKGGLVDDPEMIAPGQNYSAAFKIALLT